MDFFQFKQFKVNQDRCAMKIGTDGVLLGAWTSLKKHPNSILDIGAGTGVLSLMLAQRSNAEILDAIEIDENAFEQCVDNFESSPWADRLFCYHASLDEFTNEFENKYELIICNPPFYPETYKTKNLQRDAARFQDSMPFNHIIQSVAALLTRNGEFSVIIPFSEEDKFIQLAKYHKLYPKFICRIKGNLRSEIKRSLMSFTFSQVKVQTNQLVIEINRHEYTEDYTRLTREFYLKM